MKLLVITAPSGAGKTTLVQSLIENFPKLEFSISATTRTPRKNEKNGIDYFFLKKKDFQKKIKLNHFLEWEEVYEGSFYGTLKSNINTIWKNNQVPIFDIDVKGGLTLKDKYGENVLSIFIMPPSIEELESRLNNRKTENTEKVKQRLLKAKKEILFSSKFDCVIINDKIETAKREIHQIVSKFLGS
tara:strand:+ start:1520 stop:2080 length:561 start_codon:yes stop_codon:yes gene_type:complete